MIEPLYKAGTKVLYVWKPDTSDPVKCVYSHPDKDDWKHILIIEDNDHVIKARPDQIRGR